MGKASVVLLTKSVVDAAGKREERYIVWDSKLSGFGVRVETSGVKSFIIRYRADGGGRSAPRRFATVGRYGALTVEQARKQAKVLLGAAARGEDPAGERLAKRREMTIEALIDLYEEEGCVVQRGVRQGEPMKPRTKAYTIARLRHHVVPLLGRRRVSEVGPGEIERFVRDVSLGKSAKDEVTGPRKRIIVRGGDGAARKVVRDLSAVFSFAARRKIVPENPCANAAVRKTDNRRERYLTLEELARLGEAFDAVTASGANAKAVAIAKLWALTGCRRTEIEGLLWSEVDLERGLLTLSDSKTGRSIRPLGQAAILVLKPIERDPASEFVFPAEFGDGHYQGSKRLWSRIIKLAELPGVTPHTLRHTMGSISVSIGEGLPLTGAILGHANPRSTAIYAHVQNDPSIRAADRVTRQISAALGARSTKLCSAAQEHEIRRGFRKN